LAGGAGRSGRRRRIAENLVERAIENVVEV
jgi:hypothetical protein